jgi:hypothetical protein
VSALATGGVCLLGFLGALMGYRYLKNKKLEGNSVLLNSETSDESTLAHRGRTSSFAEEETESKDEFGKTVITLVAKAIAKRVKILGIDKKDTDGMKDFKDAVSTLLTEISDQGVDTQIDRMESSQRDALIREIAVQTKQHLVRQSAYGAPSSRFFQTGVSPEELRQKASLIAESVAKVHGARYGKEVAMMDLSAAKGNSQVNRPEIATENEKIVR